MMDYEYANWLLLFALKLNTKLIEFIPTFQNIEYFVAYPNSWGNRMT